MGPHVTIDQKFVCLTLLLGVLCLVTMGATPGGCQTNILSVNHPGGLTTLEVEDPALILTAAASGTTAAQYVYRPAGRFRLSTGSSAPTGGDPTRIGDESAIIASVLSTGQWASAFSSKTTIAIDPEGANGYFYDIHELMDTQDEGAQSELTNFWVAAPTVGSRDISGTYRLPVAFDDDDAPTAFVQVKQVLTLIGDSLMVENIVSNTDSVRHTFGVRVLFDGGFGGGSSLDGQEIVLPDGSIITTEAELPNQSINSGVLPDTWVTYDDPSNPTISIRGFLSTDEVFDPGTANRSAGLPDSVAWGQMRNMGAAGQYYFVPNEQAALGNEDWAYAVRWEPIQLSPGQSCRYVTYYGVGASTADYDSPYAFMVYAPFSLKQMTGDDPATAGTVEEYYLADDQGRSPFPISAYIDNFGAATLQDSSVRIRLPLGLELVSGESLQKSAGAVGRNEMKSVTWMVRAVDARPGQYDIKFTGPQGKILNRSISIPALPILNPLTSPRGIEMVSIPYTFAYSDAQYVFQDLGTLATGANATVVRWEPSTGQYGWFPDAITNIEPGMGFWLLNKAREVVNLPIDATPVPVNQSYKVELSPGWNQIGLPFTTSEALNSVTVLGASGNEYSMMEAYNRLILVPTVFEYDPSANDYVWEAALSEAEMDPFKGYWILAYQSCTLVFPPPSIYTSSQTMGEVTQPTEDDGWRLNMTARSGDRISKNRSCGIADGATAGVDKYDLPEPPAVMAASANSLHAAFIAGDAHDEGGVRLAADIRPSSRTNTWRYAVSTGNVGQPVTLEWGDLSDLPANLVATIVDTASGNQVYMRTASALQYSSRIDNETRVFEITVQERNNSTLAISNVTTATIGGGKIAFTYSLSVPAEIQVAIRNISGIEVGRAGTSGVSAEGTHTVIWSGQSLSGTKVPCGSYICQISAVCPETGQVTNVLRTFRVMP